MGILDKLRPQSKSTHPDPNIRIEAIHELDPADIESLNAFAKDDTDARVRRVAVARIGDASVLADIVRNESEGSVRDHALGQLVEQASKHDASVAMTAVAALASLGRERELATVAKAAGPDEVRRAAIAGVRDEKSLGSIARHGSESGARLVALERLTEPAEIEGVALRGEHADSAVAAIDRLSNPSNETLTAIAEKARTKQAQKKARTLLKVSEPAAAPVESGPAYKEADQQKARDMVAQMKTLASTSDFAQLREAYAAARVAWVELLADADIQSTVEADFENASNVVRERLAADEAARADAERQRRAMEQEQTDRAAVCARVECLNGDDITDGNLALFSLRRCETFARRHDENLIAVMNMPAGGRTDAEVDHVAAKIIRLPVADHRLPRPAHRPAGPTGDRRRRVHRSFLQIVNFEYTHCRPPQLAVDNSEFS